jgi:hypothetical protein
MGTIQRSGLLEKASNGARPPTQSVRPQKESARPDGGGRSASRILPSGPDGRKSPQAKAAIVGRVPPQKASKSAPKADASEKAKSTDRDWLTTAELATKIGWREHALRDALRGKDLPGVRRTSFGYHIDASALDEIKTTLGAPPAKGNASKRA